MRAGLVVLAATLALGTAACTRDSSADNAPSNGSATNGKTLTVLAAASLTETFTSLAETFEDDHPGVEVRLSFDSSATLAEQVVQGAPADVLATADADTMAGVVDAGAVDGDPQVFATNTLVMVVPAGGGSPVTGLDDLGADGTAYVSCVETAPCGALTAKVLEANGVAADPSSQEVDVRAVLGKVELGEADAGFVYRTDAVAAGDAVDVVGIPGAGEFVNEYPIAVTADADPELAADWVDLVLSEVGERVLTDAGFGQP